MLVATDRGAIISTTAVVVAAVIALAALVAAWMTVRDGRRASRERKLDRLLDCIGEHGARVIVGLSSGDVNQLLQAASRITLTAAIDATHADLPACRNLANEGDINYSSSADAVKTATKNALNEVAALYSKPSHRLRRPR
jgi:hypothetical protein